MGRKRKEGEHRLRYQTHERTAGRREINVPKTHILKHTFSDVDKEKKGLWRATDVTRADHKGDEGDHRYRP